jgi:phosphosulfolactate synthase (CoM biosynthesis protein A)
MPYTAHITKAERGFSVEDNSPYVDVHFEIKNDAGETVAERRQAFTADDTHESIMAELERAAKTEETDAMNREANKAFDNETRKVEETIALLNGEISK